MKSSNKVVRFDYSKFESDGFPSYDVLKNYEFWGIHSKGGRLHIDTKRYKKICEKYFGNEFLPQGMFKVRNTVYFVPERIERFDYKVNIFRDYIRELEEQWNDEYEPIFQKISTPEETYQNVRLGEMACTGCSEDYDDIEIDARFAEMRRAEKYAKVINEIYCMFLQKITTEIDRFTFIFMTKCGYKGTEFSFPDFLKFTQDKIEKNEKETIRFLRDLDGYNTYTLLHKANNFLKHNSRESYKQMYYMFPKNVKSVKEGTSKFEYENGMYAGDWLILKEGFLDKSFKKVITFFEQYCEKVLGEDLEESKWNYDDYFKDAVSAMKCPQDYFGF